MSTGVMIPVTVVGSRDCGYTDDVGDDGLKSERRKHELIIRSVGLEAGNDMYVFVLTLSDAVLPD